MNDLPLDDSPLGRVLSLAVEREQQAREQLESAKHPYGTEPEERLQVANEIIALLRSRYGACPEAGGDAVVAALVALVGVQEAQRLLGTD